MSEAIDRSRLDAFMALCLKPVELRTTDVNEAKRLARDERTARFKVWHKAYVATTYFKALKNAADAEHSYQIHVDASVDRTQTANRWEYLRWYRETIAAQLLTPATTRADIKWKQSARKDKYVPVDQTAVDAVIADDEAYLARLAARTQRGAK